jgi:hypothetical protein
MKVVSKSSLSLRLERPQEVTLSSPVHLGNPELRLLSEAHTAMDGAGPKTLGTTGVGLVGLFRLSTRADGHSELGQPDPTSLNNGLIH